MAGCPMTLQHNCRGSHIRRYAFNAERAHENDAAAGSLRRDVSKPLRVKGQFLESSGALIGPAVDGESIGDYRWVGSGN